MSTFRRQSRAGRSPGQRWTTAPRIYYALAALIVVIGVVVAATWGGAQVLQDRRAVENPPGNYADIFFTTADGVALHGRLFGQGNPAVVLAHMDDADQRSWQPFAEILAARGHTVLTFDFRGFGRSSGQKEFENLLLDMEAAVQVLRDQGAQGIFLIGAGMGGTAAMKMAARERFRGVATLSAPAEYQGLNALEDAPQVESSVLLIVAEDDEPAQQDAGEFFKAVSGQPIYQAYLGGERGTDMLSGPVGEDVALSLLRFLDDLAP